jgi:hypothetical protein
MSDINTGGPAFPCDPFAASEPKNVAEAKRLAEGMTLRDYFAAQAVQGYVGQGRSYDFADIAQASYRVADAMLSARSTEKARNV